MALAFEIRAPRDGEERQIAQLHVECWRQTYSAMLPSSYFGAELLARRVRMWTAILANPSGYGLAVAEQQDQLIGFGFAGPVADANSVRSVRLHAIYLDESHHGKGAGQALLDAVLGSESAELWVAENNPRARSFYRRNGFIPDGARDIDEDGIAAIRLVR